jgi:phosphohistidine phosphatase
MKLYIVRHAIAAPHDTPGIRDEDRDLTKEGIQKMRQAAEGLCNLDYVPDLLLSSPLIRASHTAEILLAAFGNGIEIKTTHALAPSGSRQELYREMAQYSTLNSLMLVGHQPSLGEIAGEIVWGSPEHSLDLKKGGACAIEIESLRGTPRGILVSLLTPSILRKIVDSGAR